jgi:hypothetical protein
MANPTGTTYLSANQNYIWADGDVYQIAQTDTVEAAGTGASFGGLGVANQPHQMLLNKIQYLHNHQLADEAAIGALQALFDVLTSSDVNQNAPPPSLPNLYGPMLPTATNGYLKVASNDVNLGQMQIIWQWGTIALSPWDEEPPGPGYSEEPDLPVTMSFNFPIAFPNAIWLLIPYWQANTALTIPVPPSGISSFGINNFTIAAVTPLQLQNNQIAYSLQKRDLTDDTGNFFGPYAATANILGNIGWVALGY